MESINVTASNELDTKINGILSIIVQDDGDTFAKRAEMYYQKRPELVDMVEDLQKSYRALAEKYDQLRSQLQGPKNYVEGTEFDQPEENQNVNGVALMQRNASDGSMLMENEKLWDELRFKVSELVEDDISHQSELMKNSVDDDSVFVVSNKVPKKTRSRLSSRLCFGRCMKIKC